MLSGRRTPPAHQRQTDKAVERGKAKERPTDRSGRGSIRAGLQEAYQKRSSVTSRAGEASKDSNRARVKRFRKERGHPELLLARERENLRLGLRLDPCGDAVCRADSIRGDLRTDVGNSSPIGRKRHRHAACILPASA
eukprot:6197793-Pleurochrysis_carterae.AAC.5